MKTYGPLASVMHHCRSALQSGILAMESRGVHLTASSFKEAGALCPQNMARVCGYMASQKATVPGMKQLCSTLRGREMFDWHVYHKDDRSQEYVHPSRSMLFVRAPAIYYQAGTRPGAFPCSPHHLLSQAMKLPCSTY